MNLHRFLSRLDADPGGQKWPTKIEKSEEISCFEVLDVLFWGLKASQFSWNMNVLHGGLGINKLKFLRKKNYDFFFSCKILLTSAIKTLDPDNIIIPWTPLLGTYIPIFIRKDIFSFWRRKVLWCRGYQRCFTSQKNTYNENREWQFILYLGVLSPGATDSNELCPDLQRRGILWVVLPGSLRAWNSRLYYLLWSPLSRCRILENLTWSPLAYDLIYSSLVSRACKPIIQLVHQERRIL